jgi:type I restriction enzyme S subunit
MTQGIHMHSLTPSPLAGEGWGEGVGIPAASTLLTQNLPLLAGAPNGIKKLRELILELAVRGKLVPQDPNDEPASELLKRIAEEKARLVAEGKIKKQKPLPEFGEQAQPFELPVDWVWTRLGEITNFGNTTKKDEIPDDAWVLDLEDIEKDTSRLLQKARFYERNSLSDKNSFTNGDVLYGKLRPYLNKVLVAEEDGFCTTEILPFRCYGPFVAHYFRIALKSPYFLSYVNARSYGMKMPRLGTEDGRQAFFPLPPLAEQHRIVAKVDELMGLCDRLEAQQADAESAHAQLVQALLDSLTQASDATDFAANWQRLAEHYHTLFTTEPSIDALKQTLLQLAVMGKLETQRQGELVSELLFEISEEFERLITTGKLKKPKYESVISKSERPFKIPDTWTWVRLGDIASVIDPNPSHRMPRYVEKGIAFISTENFSNNDDIDFSIGKKVDESTLEDQVSKFDIREGAFAISRIGTIGKTRPLPVSRHYCLSHALCVVSPHLNVFNSRYLRLAITAENVLMHAHSGVKSIGVPDLGVGTIRSMPIPVPPLAEQHRIVAKVDQLMALCDQLKTRLIQARQLNEQLASTLFEQAVARSD